jgi:hypothetical protein
MWDRHSSASQPENFVRTSMKLQQDPNLQSQDSFIFKNDLSYLNYFWAWVDRILSQAETSRKMVGGSIKFFNFQILK